MIVGRIGTHRRVRRTVAVQLAAAGGVVATAVVAHVGAGGAMPAPLLLAGLVALLAASSVLLPARMRSPRVALALAVSLQPVLHALFQRTTAAAAPVPGSGVGSVGHPMLLAHLAAAGLATWWVARGAVRAVTAAERLVARIVPARLASVLPADAAPAAPDTAAPRVRSRVLPATASLRGPPVRVHLRPV